MLYDFHIDKMVRRDDLWGRLRMCRNPKFIFRATATIIILYDYAHLPGMDAIHILFIISKINIFKNNKKSLIAF